MLAMLAALQLLALRANAASPPKEPEAAPKTAAKVELVGHGTTRFRIEVRSPKAIEASFAAGELVKYLAKIGGTTVEIADAKAPPGPRMVIGMRNELSAADRALLPPAAEGFDGYAIAVVAGKDAPRVVIGGDEARGLVYAVYDLLERLGCVFTHPRLDPTDPEAIPVSRDVAVPEGRWAVASKVRFRTLAWFEWRERDPDKIATTPEELVAQIDWAMKSRYNVFESTAMEAPPNHPLARALHAAKDRGMMLQAPGHNFGLFIPTDPANFAAHPEYFGLYNGERVLHWELGAQFCWTNPKAQKAFTDNVVAFVKARPDLDVLELSGLDGGKLLHVCGCEECAKHSPTDNVINLLNGTVQRLAKERPDLVVETLGGYQYAEEPPATAKPDERLRVFWADWNRSQMAGYSSPTYAKRRENLEAWLKAFDGRLTVFQYYADQYKNSWFMGPLAVQMLEDREYILKNHIDGVLTLLFPDGYWWRSSINAWLAGRVFYDASTDPFALLREYALAYYGPAGEPMAAYLDEWARDPALGMRSRFGAMPFHFGKLRAQRAKELDEATRLAEGDPVAKRRVATLVRLHLLAETFMAIDLLTTHTNELREKGDLAGAQRELEAARRRLSLAKGMSDELIAEKRGLVDPEIDLSTFTYKTRIVDQAGTKLAAASTPPDGSAPSPGASSSAPTPTAR